MKTSQMLDTPTNRAALSVLRRALASQRAQEQPFAPPVPTGREWLALNRGGGKAVRRSPRA